MMSQGGNLKFKIKNLGCIKEGGFEQKPLTIFCGPNNSGKTWAMYSLYYYYSYIGDRQSELEKDNSIENISLKKFNANLSNRLNDVFSTNLEALNNAHFNLDIDEEGFKKVFINNQTKPVLFPAERNGLHLFFRELRSRRTALLHHASKKEINLNELLRDVISSRYAQPIAHYIDWLNDIEEIKKNKSDDFHDFAQKIQKKLLSGTFRVDRTGSIEFKPYQKKRDGINTKFMSLHLTSSTVKSLFGLWFYLEHQAKVGDVLMIDEPEINIHPENQRKIARLLAQLVNKGLRVVISTHSDYIIREFNTLIMLNEDKKSDLRKKHKYEQNEILNPKKVGAYLFDNQTIEPFEISDDDGIYATTFDNVITNLNEINNDVYYSLQEIKDNN